MKKLIVLLVICLNTSVALASSDWETMIWDQDNWYKGQSIINGQVVTHAAGQKTGILNAKMVNNILKHFLYQFEVTKNISFFFKFLLQRNTFYNMLN